MNVEEQVRRLVIDGEQAARSAIDPRSVRVALQPQYGLYLKVLTRSPRPKLLRATEYLRVVAAMRDPQAYASLDALSDDTPPAFDEAICDPVAVLAAFLARLPETVVLVIESGTNVLTMLTVSGRGPLQQRIELERAGSKCVAALTEMIRQQLEDLERIADGEPVTQSMFEPIERAAAAAWASIPASIRSAIDGARTILYLPSAFGDLNAFPLELLRTERGWLGVTHSIARLSSLRTLFEQLSPNRMPLKFDAQGEVVRADDSAELTGADTEVAAVCEQLAGLGLRTHRDDKPSKASFRAALDRGSRILHYCGHGFAGHFGESLALSATQAFDPTDLSQLSGAGTPFVYLSTCDVGRARMASTGNAVGVSARLIEKGSPGVVGYLTSVPDRVARSMAGFFYCAAAAATAGAAVSSARGQMSSYPPSCWGACAMFGDPNLRLSGGRAGQRTRDLTVSWDTYIGRFLAFRTPHARQQAVSALGQARAIQGNSDVLRRVSDWVQSSFGTEEPEVFETRLALCHELAAVDVVAACELRMLLAMEALQGGFYGPRKPDVVINPEELHVGLYCARAIHDVIAWAAFAIEAGGTNGVAYERTTVLHMLTEAQGILNGWRIEEPAAARMLETAAHLRSTLKEG